MTMTAVMAFCVLTVGSIPLSTQLGRITGCFKPHPTRRSPQPILTENDNSPALARAMEALQQDKGTESDTGGATPEAYGPKTPAERVAEAEARAAAAEKDKKVAVFAANVGKAAGLASANARA